MLDHELEQHADDVVLHAAQPFGAAAALAILQQQLLGALTPGRQRDLEPLRDRAPQLLLGAGVLFGERGEVGDDRGFVEQEVGAVAGLVEREHAEIPADGAQAL